MSLRADKEAYFEELTSRVAEAVSTQEHPSGFADIVPRLRVLFEAILSTSIYQKSFPWHHESLEKDRKLLKRLKRLLSEAEPLKQEPPLPAEFGITVAHPALRRGSGRMSPELGRSLEVEIAQIEMDLAYNASEYGTARTQKNFTYNHAGTKAFIYLRSLGISYPAGEAVVFLWYCGACDLGSEIDVIDPFLRVPDDYQNPYYELDSIARKRFSLDSQQEK